MLQIYRAAIGAGLLGLAVAPAAALAEESPATPAPTLISNLSLPRAAQPADAKLGVNVASLPPDAMVPPLPLPTERGFYISADGTGQSMSLPPVNLGLAYISPVGPGTPFTYNGSVAYHQPQATGAGVDLAFGYFLPPGTVSPAWGAAPRVELDFSMVNAGEQSAGSFAAPLLPFAGITGLMLNGVAINDAPLCSATAGINCFTNSRESTDFMTWHLAAKVASDFPLGGLVTATPSLSVIGGEGHNDTSVNQQFQQFVGGGATPLIAQSYSARTHVNWSDIGGKAGLTLKAPLSSWVTASVAGSVAVVDRDASLRGSDIFNGTFPGGIPLPTAPQTNPFFSSIASSRSTTAVLSNLEISTTFQLWANVSLRAFGGVNYDDSVPGVRAPTFFGSETASPGGTPARIKFVGETSLYGGAGIVVHF